MQSTKTRKLKKTQNDLYHDLLKIKDYLTDTADGVKSRAHDMVTDLIEDVQGRTTGLQNEIEGYAKEKPLQSLGIAVLIGVVIAKVIL
jgi:ElaB/YqjD/DUF883 family membrane-anchored ribosome-binding protein